MRPTLARPSASRRAVILAAAAALAAPAALSPRAASADTVGPTFWTNWRGLAIRGADPTAYFTEGRPVDGSAEHALEWSGAYWRFASAEARAAFQADPAAYAPQFGGHCAWAVAQGYLASVTPEAWDIVDGKLYLNYSKGVQARWRRDVPGHIAKGEANWPEVLAS